MKFLQFSRVLYLFRRACAFFVRLKRIIYPHSCIYKVIINIVAHDFISLEQSSDSLTFLVAVFFLFFIHCQIKHKAIYIQENILNTLNELYIVKKSEQIFFVLALNWWLLKWKKGVCNQFILRSSWKCEIYKNKNSAKNYCKLFLTSSCNNSPKMIRILSKAKVNGGPSQYSIHMCMTLA